MANRILLGADSGGALKLRVSKPGVNVLTGSLNDMLLDSDEPMLQVIDSGVFPGVSGGQTRNLSWAPLGFAPFIYIYAPNGSISMNYTSDNAAVLRTSSSSAMYWAIFNVARG